MNWSASSPKLLNRHAMTGSAGRWSRSSGVAVALGHRCLRLPWRRPPLMRCWSISIRGPAASVGGETAPGLRWPDLALQGGRLNWSAVRAALPRPRGISVLSGTRRGYELDAGPVDAVIDAGRRGGVTVVCDLPRRLTDATQAALDAADLVVLVSPCDVRACAAAATMAPVLTAINPNLGLVVRGPSPGGLRAAEVADVAGVPLLASMRAQPRLAEQLEHGGLRLRRRSVLASAARRVLGVLPRAGSGRHGRAA